MKSNLLKDALYYTHKDSGSSVEMAHGVIVGIVSALMAQGMLYGKAIRIVSECLPEGYRPETMPSAWKEDIT